MPPIRRLAPGDAAAHRALRLRALREHPEAFTSSYEEEALAPLAVTAARLAAARNSFWGAFEHDALCGMVGLERETRLKNQHKGIVVGMYVVPEAGGRGLGRQLLDALLRQARAEGLESLVLTVTEGNARAQRLYERAGFRSFGVEPRALKLGARAWAKVHMVLEFDT